MVHADAIELDHFEIICTNICNTLDNVLGAWVVRNAQAIASCVKPEFPRPIALEQKKLFVQCQLMVGMARTNEQMYGKMRHISIGFEHIDFCLFSLMSDEIFLAMACARPYSLEVIARAVAAMTANPVSSWYTSDAKQHKHTEH